MHQINHHNSAHSTSTKSQEEAREVRRVTLWGLVINIVLSIAKFIAGLMGNSQALVADAAHSLSDCTTDIAVIVGSYFWTAPPDDDHPYGHRRIETMVTIFIGASVGVVGLVLSWDALTAIRSGDYKTPTWIAAVGALVSIVVKEVLYQYTQIHARKIRSVSLSANAWHHRSDAISSIPVLIAVGFSMLSPEWVFMDQIGAVVVAGFLIKASIEIIKPGLRELADAGASSEECKEIANIAKDVKGVQGIHDMRTRFIGNDLLVDIHIEVDEKISVIEGHNIAVAVKNVLIEKVPQVIDVLTHIDPNNDSEFNEM